MREIKGRSGMEREKVVLLMKGLLEVLEIVC